jgi:hypothetical protein
MTPCGYDCIPRSEAGNGFNFTSNTTGQFGPNSVTANSTDEQKLGFVFDLLSGNNFGKYLRNAFPNATVSFYPIFDANGTLIGMS